MSPQSTPPTSALADVLLLRGRDGVLSPPLRHLCGEPVAACGLARTVAFAATPDGGGGTFDELYELLDSDLDGEVLVVAGAETVPGAVWGQILSQAAHRAGAAAVLVAGAVRDVAELRTSRLPVWGLSEHTMGATGLACVVDVDVPVNIGGCPIAVGDTIAVDASGAVRLRQGEAAELLEQGGLYAAAEQRLLDDIAAGVPLARAYQHKRDVRRLLERRS